MSRSLAEGHMAELFSNRIACSRLDQPPDGELVDDSPGGQFPLGGRCGLADGIGKPAVAPEPARCPAMQLCGVIAGMTLHLEPQGFREERVIAVPTLPQRLDERIRLCQCSERADLLAIGELTGQFVVDAV